MNVLLAEDSFANALMAKKLLEKLGCQVDHVENGRLAADRAKSITYNLILMDLQMPVLDGYQSTEEIRNAGVSAPIIALTASATDDEQKRIVEYGMNGFLLKPVTMDGLNEIIVKWVTK
ncbi:MAG: response regulator [Bacteroidetes bacterium]|nr:response regulator [Bacteroidota bacterium]MDA1121461.1 response regulator [Bacteroidota bacterium]